MDHLDSWFTPETKSRHTWFLVIIILAVIGYTFKEIWGAIF